MPLCLPADLAPGSAETLAWAVRHANSHRVWPQAVTLGVMLAIGYVIMSIIRSRKGQSVSWDALLSLIAAHCITWLALIVLSGRSVARAARAAVAECLEHGLCPSCGYGLASSAPDADGIRTCPECGGAWRAPERSESVLGGRGAPGAEA